MPERERWRMTLQELCHRVKATPAELNQWAALGALGPGFQHSTENKWRHITRAVARRAVVYRAMMDSGFQPESAARLADEHADVLAKGEKVVCTSGSVVFELDPEVLKLP